MLWLNDEDWRSRLCCYSSCYFLVIEQFKTIYIYSFFSKYWPVMVHSFLPAQVLLWLPIIYKKSCLGSSPGLSSSSKQQQFIKALTSFKYFWKVGGCESHIQITKQLLIGQILPSGTFPSCHRTQQDLHSCASGWILSQDFVVCDWWCRQEQESFWLALVRDMTLHFLLPAPRYEMCVNAPMCEVYHIAVQKL